VSKESKNRPSAADTALAAGSAVAGKGSYDVNRIERRLRNWDRAVKDSAKGRTGASQIDSVYDAYVRGGKDVSNTRVLGRRAGNLINDTISGAKKFNIDLPGKDNAGASDHYRNFIRQSPEKLKQYMTDKALTNHSKARFTGEAEKVIRNPRLSISDKVDTLQSRGMSDAAKEFNRATGRFGGEMVGGGSKPSISQQYLNQLSGYTSRAKRGLGAASALLAGGLGAKKFIESRKNKKQD
jgi:hypothetical protein